MSATDMSIPVEGPESPGGAPLVVEVKDVARRFGETRALTAATLAVRPGEIHALLGENGSGKSTLVKVLGGVIAPDAGEVVVDGRSLALKTPWAAAEAGISVVFQETLVVDELSVLDNVILGQTGVFRRRRADKAWVAEVRDVLTELGLEHVDPGAPMWSLDLGERQLVTIARAMLRKCRLLILDEATSALDVTARDRVFAALERRRDAGIAVLLITHRMDEIARLADRVTILRGGRTVATVSAATPTQQLVVLMTGDEAAGQRAGARHHAGEHRPPVLRARGLRLTAGSAPFDFDIAPGDLIGVAGLEGHGQSAFLRCLTGVAAPADGTVEVAEASAWHAVGSARRAASKGIVYVPRDRKREGLFGPRSVAENLTISVVSGHAAAGVLRPRRLRAEAQRLIGELRVRGAGPRTPVMHLSGGNQQKVLLARAVSMKPRVLVLNDPLRGVDQGVKHELYELFEQLSESGVAVVLLSTELEELVTVCPKVAVFHEQTLHGVLEAEGVQREALVAAMFGQRYDVSEVS